MKKKLFSCLMLACILVSCMTLFIGCGNNDPPQPQRTLTLNSTIKTDTDIAINEIIDNAYNKLTASTHFSVAQANELLTNDITYYVEIGTLKNFDMISSITIGETKYNADSTFLLSVGNNAQISDKVFYVENNKLYVSAIIVDFEGVNSIKIKINDDEFDFKVYESTGTFELSNVAWQSGSINTIERIATSNEYNVTIKKGTNYMELYYEDATADDIIIRKSKYTNGIASYGITGVESTTGYPYGIFPVSYTDNIETLKERFENRSIEIELYVREKGIATAKINFLFE